MNRKYIVYFKLQSTVISAGLNIKLKENFVALDGLTWETLFTINSKSQTSLIMYVFVFYRNHEYVVSFFAFVCLTPFTSHNSYNTMGSI